MGLAPLRGQIGLNSILGSAHPPACGQIAAAFGGRYMPALISMQSLAFAEFHLVLKLQITGFFAINPSPADWRLSFANAALARHS